MRPKGVAIAVMAQYGIMPLTAFSLAKVGVSFNSDLNRQTVTRTL